MHEGSTWPGVARAAARPGPNKGAKTRSSTVTKIEQAIDATSLWLWFALAGASGASVLALGLLLRSNKALSPRVVLGTVLHSAAWALGVFLLSYSRFTDDLPFLLGVSIMSGMGAASFVDLAFMLVRQRMGVGPLPDPYQADPRQPSAKDGQT
jgi:hypothetical protein